MKLIYFFLLISLFVQISMITKLKSKLSQDPKGPVGWNIDYLKKYNNQNYINYYYKQAKRQSESKSNLTVTIKTQTTWDGSKNDIMSFPNYFWHPEDILSFPSPCVNCASNWNSFQKDKIKYPDTTKNSKNEDIKNFYIKCYGPSSDSKYNLKSRADQNFPDQYISCDGHTNTEAIKAFKGQEIDTIIENTRVMVLGWFVGVKNDNDGIQDEIARTLDYFFINPDTKMNPNAKYLQFRNFSLKYGLPYSALVIGKDSESYGSGTIGFRRFYLLVDSLMLLESANPKDHVKTIINNLRGWFGQLQDWYDSSPQGNLAANSINNIGTFYFVQYCAVAYFTGKRIDKAKNYIYSYFNQNNKKGPNYYIQFDFQCLQTLEANRGKSLEYQVFNLHALYILGGFADVWNLKFSNGKKWWDWSCFKDGVDLLVNNYIKNLYNEEQSYVRIQLAWLLLHYDNKYPKAGYMNSAKKIIENEKLDFQNWLKYSQNQFPN